MPWTPEKGRCIRGWACYKDHTLDDIHAADEKDGLLEWLYMTGPTREELLSRGGAAFGDIRRLPFFEFSTEEIVADLVGCAAVCGKPGEALQCRCMWIPW